MRGVVGALFITNLNLCWRKALAEAENDDDFGNADEDAISQNRIGGDDDVILFFLFVLFGFVVSVFGSLLCYVSFLEDRLMQEYMKEGVRIEGDVVAMEFTRGVGRNEEALMKFDNEKEYFVTIKYSFLLSGIYPVRVRKQLRLFEGEFIHPDQPEFNSPHPRNNKSNTVFQRPCSPGILEVDDRAFDASLNLKPIIEIVTSNESFCNKFQFGPNGQKVQLLVHPTHPLSALSVRQVERRISAKYRLFSFIFVITATIIAIFCYQLASQFLQEVYSDVMIESSLADERHFSRIRLLHLLLVAVALIPIPCIHYFLNEAISRSLRAEYLESGEFIKGGQEDDASFSTWNTESMAGFKLSVGSLSTLA
jgi:hypothetical protein